MRRVRFTFIEGYEYEDEDEVNIFVGMKTDGTKEFYLAFNIMQNYNSIPQEVLDEYPIELVDSGITRIIDSDFLDGWVDLLLFGGIYHVEIEGIKYTLGYSGGGID